MTVDSGGVAEPGELVVGGVDEDSTDGGAPPNARSDAPVAAPNSPRPPVGRKVRFSANVHKLIGAATGANLADGIGQIAYPWLASAVTRNPLLIALIAIAQQLPWLVLTLPVGVLTDRVERRRLMVGANVGRVVLSIGVAVAVLVAGDALVGPDALDTVTGTNTGLYLVILLATLLFGVAEVVHDNAAQTFLPTVVPTEQLERANGRLMSVEVVANRFGGPPLGSFLLTIGYAVPFFVNAGALGLAAVLVALIAPRLHWRGAVAAPAIPDTADAAEDAVAARASWRAELAEGFSYLWRHELLRPLALTLGALNLLGNVAMAVWVLFAQDVLNTSAREFALVTAIAGIGGVVGGVVAGRILERLRPGVVLVTVMLVSMVATVVIGLSSHWLVAAVLMSVEFVTIILWNVLTVSLRQSIIPDRLLGRVNSVYRFFGWGMMPIGSLLGGLIATIADGPLSHEWSLRLPSMVAGAGYLFVLVYARRHLTTAVIERAKATAPR